MVDTRHRRPPPCAVSCRASSPGPSRPVPSTRSSAPCGCITRRPTSRSSSARTPSRSARTPGRSARSGEPYITHPVAVAQILADLGIGAKTIAAALLHDTVEDTEYTLDELRDDFGDEIAMLVDGVTKLDKVKYGDSAQAETVRKMIVAMSKDIRVLIIKLADRLHNARTWGFVPAGIRDPQGARRRSRSTRRSRTASASRRSSGSSKTSRSRCSTPSSTSRSRAW